MCGGFTKLVLVTRSTPPSLALDELHAFDQQVRHIHTTDSSWKQAQLSLSRGGLRLCSLALHSTAAFIASISTAGLASQSICTTCLYPLRVHLTSTVLVWPLLLVNSTLESTHLTLFLQRALLLTRLVSCQCLRPMPLHGSLLSHLQAWV